MKHKRRKNMYWKSYDPEVTKIKARNAEIFKETTKCIKAGEYRTDAGNVIKLDVEPMVKGSECFHDEFSVTGIPCLGTETKVLVEKADCLETACRLVNDGYNPILLNFASAGHPGGGVERGSRAQEETICRRSTLTRSIYAFDARYAEKYRYPHIEGNNYPIVGQFSAIYSPEVTVFRQGRECVFMDNPYNVAVITCAALNLNGRHEIKLTPDGHMPKRAIDITLNKIRTIFRIALAKGHDSMVLGAFGCGAFKTPPEEMAALFRQVTGEPEFKNKFRLISYSIIEDHNSHDKNYNAFKAVLG